MEFHTVHQKKKLLWKSVRFTFEIGIGSHRFLLRNTHQCLDHKCFWRSSNCFYFGSLTYCTKKKANAVSTSFCGITNCWLQTTHPAPYPTLSSRPLVRSPLPVDPPPLPLRVGAPTAHSSLHLHADVVLRRSPPLSSEAHPAHLVQAVFNVLHTGPKLPDSLSAPALMYLAQTFLISTL